MDRSLGTLIWLWSVTYYILRSGLWTFLQSFYLQKCHMIFSFNKLAGERRVDWRMATWTTCTWCWWKSSCSARYDKEACRRVSIIKDQLKACLLSSSNQGSKAILFQMIVTGLFKYELIVSQHHLLFLTVSFTNALIVMCIALWNITFPSSIRM